MCGTVRTVDFSLYRNGSKQDQLNFSRELLASFDETGFVKIINHPVEDARVQEVFKMGKAFFDQPLEVKNEILSKIGPDPLRGYSGISSENTGKLDTDEKIRILKDAKEHFDQGPLNDPDFPNKWPTTVGLTEFRPFMEALYETCEMTCAALLEALELALGMEPGELVKRSVPSATDMRLTHYPAISSSTLTGGKITRIAQHVDFGVISLLFQDNTGGLEVEDRTRSGAFFPVLPTNNFEMLVNAGNTLQRWTNGRILAGVHRVTVPEPLKDMKAEDEDVLIPARYSLAFLLKAQRTVSMGPLPQFVTAENPAKYDYVNAIEYQIQRQSVISECGVHQNMNHGWTDTVVQQVKDQCSAGRNVPSDSYIYGIMGGGNERVAAFFCNFGPVTQRCSAEVARQRYAAITSICGWYVSGWTDQWSGSDKLYGRNH
ncbi:2-oxoglutarate-dependent dioxygenase gloC [Paramyrothecium foliicola]|nr:2-oxoglutarate-dependent dioxygenase gloC [Paramyrothecium foliicola]